MSERRILSAIVPAFGSPEQVLACVAALRQSFEPPEEIIVVDDGTPGGLHLADSSIRIVQHARNRGPSAARNSGAAAAAGEWLLFVDADIEVERDVPQRVRRTLTQNPEVSLVFGVYSEDRRARPVTAYKNLYWRHKFLGLPADNPNVNTALMAVRREVFEQVGGFNESAYIGEDREFGHAVAARGHQTRLDKQLTGAHRKRFTLRRLVREHFVNTVNASLVVLATRVQMRRADQEVLGARFRFLAAIGVAGAAAAVLLAAVAAGSRPLGVAFGALFVLFGVLTGDLLQAARRLKGWPFAALCLGLAFVEGLVACAGVAVAFVRYFVLGNPRRDFRI
jgi:GT2 family glycosyltransferase